MDIEQFRQEDIAHEQKRSNARDYVRDRIKLVGPIAERLVKEANPSLPNFDFYPSELNWCRDYKNFGFSVEGTDDAEFPVEIFDYDDIADSAIIHSSWLTPDLSTDRIEVMVKRTIFDYIEREIDAEIEATESSIEYMRARLIANGDNGDQDYYTSQIVDREEYLSSLREITSIINGRTNPERAYDALTKRARAKRNEENEKRAERNRQRRAKHSAKN